MNHSHETGLIALAILAVGAVVSCSRESGGIRRVPPSVGAPARIGISSPSVPSPPEVAQGQPCRLADSEWTITRWHQYPTVRRSLGSGRHRRPNGQFVVFEYRVVNRSTSEARVAFRPAIVAPDGSLYEPLDDEGQYITEGSSVVGLDPILAGATGMFQSVVQVPANAVGLRIKFHGLGPAGESCLSLLEVH